jgi:octaprenyl-diphosphate synthase
MSVRRPGTRVLSLIKPQLQQVRATLRELWTDASESIRPLILGGSLDGGKLLRPSLLLLSGGLFGTITADHIHAAAILEMVHSVSLLHDDVLDEGLVRRGVPTLNRRWGNRTAILLGDLVLAKVFALTAHLAPDTRVVLGRMIGRMCDGEIEQTACAGDFQITERRYLGIVSQKTAALFKGACALGARLAGASASQCRPVARFGYNAGMAYQMMDDLLDIIGDCTVLRKTLGADVRKAKATLPVIHALDVLAQPQRKVLLQKLGSRSLGAAELSGVIVDTGSEEYVLGRIDACVSRAVTAVRHIPHTRMKVALLALLRNYCRPTRSIAVERTIAGQL